jgi:methylmalonyl-CoA epimerase
MLKKIDHIGIATKSIQEAIPFWTTGMGLKNVHEEIVADQKVRTVFLPVADVNIELLEGTDPESAISRFVEKRGEGMHHICFEVDDIHSAISQLKSQGFTMIDQEPRKGAHGKLVAFVHPKSSGGVLIELSQDAGTPHRE